VYLGPLYFCLFSFLVSFILGKHLSKGSIFINILSLLYSLIISFFIFYEVGLLHSQCYINIFPWIQISNIDIYWSFVFDTISSTMLLVILLVSLCANIYSVEYMLYEPHKVRFFAYLSLFTFTMMMLVLSNTLIQLFLGWELVGITSYLLINFWYTRIQANKSSILAIMANKVGDILLLCTCLLLYFYYNSLYFNVIFLCSDHTSNYIQLVYNNISDIDTKGYLITYNNSIIYILINKVIININNYTNYNIYFITSTIICFFIIIASVCKSAQSGFHFWLAEAMEGPTPVSSLLHAATMVTAGIFLTVRCSYLFNYSSDIPIYVILIGSITSFFASLIGLTQNDLKKIVAYSTCSQLGYMFLSNGICSYNVTMFHLFNHAFFKALLFLTSGYIIHILSNEQDLRKMGGLIKIIPLPYICIFIGSISLMGIPYLSGFFSKDTIIESFYNVVISSDVNIKYYSIIFYSQILLIISAVFTILYSVKLIYYVFINTYNGYYHYILNIHFSKYFIIFPLIVLSILSITSGFIFSDLMIGYGSTFWNNSLSMINYLYQSNTNVFFIELGVTRNLLVLLPYEFSTFTYYYITIIVVYFTLISIYIYYNYNYNIYLYFLGSINIGFIIYTSLNKKVLFFNRIIINNILYIFYKESFNTVYKLIDKQVFEILGPYGIVCNIKYLLKVTNKITTGLIYHYTGFIILTLMLFFIVLTT